jgi:hypothetical protein
MPQVPLTTHLTIDNERPHWYFFYFVTQLDWGISCHRYAKIVLHSTFRDRYQYSCSTRPRIRPMDVAYM